MAETKRLMTEINLTNLEAILFAAAHPVQTAQLALVFALPVARVRELIDRYAVSLDENRRGLRLLRQDDTVQLMTAPETAPAVEAFLGIEAAQKLTRAAIEVLTIIAYKQPITRPGIEAIRGVNSDSVVRSLQSRGLIEEAGRADTPGRPLLYATTAEFLRYFGLSSVADLPPYEVIIEDEINVLKE